MNTGYTEAGNRRATGPWQGSFISQAHFINKSIDVLRRSQDATRKSISKHTSELTAFTGKAEKMTPT